MIRVPLALTVAILARQSAVAQSAIGDSAAIEAYVRPYVESNNFSGQILVVKGGRPILSRAYGLANRESAIANTTASEMHIASMSMQFTAAAIMRLVDSGKLTLDTRVSTIVPTVRGGDLITIRNLLEMRSGLADINQRSDYAEILAHHQTPASLVAVISNDTLLSAPGSKYLHEEHSAYNLLALIVEKKTGLPFRAALRALVFDPLRMTHSGADDDASPSDVRARGYDPDGVSGLKPTTPIHWSGKTGNASVYTDASDEAKWVDALFNRQFLSPAARAVVVDSTGPVVGYGWFRRPSSRFGEFAYSMSGRSPGFASLVLHLPRSNLTVVVLSNIYSSATGDIGNDIAAIVLHKPYKPFVIESSPSPAALRALDGRTFLFGQDFYQPNATLTLSSKGAELFLRWPSGDLSPLIPVSEDHFLDRAYWEPVVIERDSAGTPVAITYDRFRGRSTSPVAAAPARAEVLVLGVYHMANPGHDIFNTQADDVLAPKRQQEIAQLIEVLKRFRPTKIAIEADPYGPRVTKYSDYLAGKYTLTANEIDQIGYRLAKELGHQKVYPVDVDGDFPWPRVVNYAKGSGHAKELDAITTEIGNMVKAQNAYLASHTVLETLLYLNTDEKVAEDVGYYHREAHLGEPGDWAGADLLADWYRRNIRIFSNVVHLADAPNDRVLVIFGSGHLGWLRHDFGSDPTIRLRKLAEFAR